MKTRNSLTFDECADVSLVTPVTPKSIYPLYGKINLRRAKKIFLLYSELRKKGVTVLQIRVKRLFMRFYSVTPAVLQRVSGDTKSRR